MRRPTLNPRPSLKPSLQTSRPSLPTRRDVRMLRDKANISSSIQILDHFLTVHNYANKSLSNPSAKDVQCLYKFLFSFIDSSFEYGSRFEDDALNILKGIKYPYITEINRSQFIAVTPHSWPVLLSMFTWVVELITNLEGKDQESLSLNSLFYEHVRNGYQKFLDGEDEIDDEIYKSKVFDMYQEIFTEIDKRVQLLKEIEDKIENVREGSYEVNDIGNKKENLIDKKREVISDIKALNIRKKQLEEKKKKYEMLNEKLKMGNEELEEELTFHKNEIQDLKREIAAQKINPEDIREMNKEKIEMYTEIEKLKPQRENLIREVNECEKFLNDQLDSADKLIYDLKGLINELNNNRYKNQEGCVGSNMDEYDSQKEVEVNNNECNNNFGFLPISLTKESGIYKTTGNFYEFDKSVVNGITYSDISLNDLDLSYSTLEMKNSELEITMRELKENIKHLDEKLITLGKLYLEKKSLHEIEQRKSNGELNKIESELMKLDLESNHSLLVSEQRLQMARIQYEKMMNTIKRDSEEIEVEIVVLSRYLVAKRKEMNLLINKENN